MKVNANSTTSCKTSIKKKHPWRKRIGFFFLLNFLLAALVLLAGMLFIRHRLQSLPVVDAQYLSTYEPSKILDINGEIIWQPTDQRSKSLTYEEIPDFYKTAIIEVEDAEFWESPGVSIKGIANMVYGVIRSKIDTDYKPRGGSTIDQQLIKNKFYDGGSGYDVTTRKIQELFLAIQLNENFSKEEILTFYVNDLEYNEGATGVAACMMTYFGKTPADYVEATPQNKAELAYLAGLSQAPTRYNLYADPESAHKRMRAVLQILLDAEAITQTEYDEIKACDLSVNLQPRGWETSEQVVKNKEYKHYTDGVMHELDDMGYHISDVSLTVKTFLDPATFDAMTDMVQNPKYYLDDAQQTGVAVVRKDGVVVALIGSSNADDEYNRALSDVRSSGSAMKPFTAYGPLLQYFGDQYNTASLFDTSDYQYPGSNAIMHNYGGGQYGERTMREALRFSYNTPVARIDDEILGSVRMKTFLHQLGADNKETYSSVDGIGLNISPLQSAAAYNALLNNGTYIKPRFVDTITFSDDTVKTVEPQTTKAMNPSVAYVLSQMLRGVPGGDGTASSAAIPSYIGYGGKTGSVKFDDSVNAPMPYGDGSSDVWYNSFTNEGYAVSVWCGYDTPNTSPRIPDYYKGQQDINRELQQLANGDKAIPDWPMPEGVTCISGSDLQAHYQVTDSKDLNTTGMSWADISMYPDAQIKEAKPDNTIPEDWELKETSEWFSYYKQQGTDLPAIIDKEFYDKLKGGS